MRAGVEGLSMPYSLTTMVPGYLQEDQFLTRMLASFDDVLAPVTAVLDNLEAYFDPRVAPSDFVDWLASWVGAVLDDNWPDELRRRVVLSATRVNRRRGTVAGLVELISLVTEGDVTVDDGADTRVSGSPTSASGEAEPTLRITVRADRPEAVRVSLLQELVESTKPAHLPHQIEVVKR